MECPSAPRAESGHAPWDIPYRGILWDGGQSRQSSHGKGTFLNCGRLGHDRGLILMTLRFTKSPVLPKNPIFIQVTAKTSRVVILTQAIFVVPRKSPPGLVVVGPPLFTTPACVCWERVSPSPCCWAVGHHERECVRVASLLLFPAAYSCGVQDVLFFVFV